MDQLQRRVEAQSMVDKELQTMGRLVELGRRDGVVTYGEAFTLMDWLGLRLGGNVGRVHRRESVTADGQEPVQLLLEIHEFVFARLVAFGHSERALAQRRRVLPGTFLRAREKEVTREELLDVWQEYARIRGEPTEASVLALSDRLMAL
jgi:hypothetical protein